MNTGIYYLYEYKNNEKIRNTGFIKLTKQEHTCFLQIHARNIPVTSQDTVRFSAFYLENDMANAKEFTDIACQNHIIAEKTTISELAFPNQFQLQQIDGFFLTLPHGEVLAATASNICFDASKITFVPSASGTASKPADTADAPVTEPLISETEPEPSTEKSAVIKTTEPIETTETIKPIKVETTCNPSVRKIQRSELSCLPRRYWNIANNSFLLHGYYNYNHLLLVKEDGHYWLGVPGIYDPKESRAAELFGFSQFTDSYNKQLSLTEDERNDYGRFGYWCRYFK